MKRRFLFIVLALLTVVPFYAQSQADALFLSAQRQEMQQNYKLALKLFQQAEVQLRAENRQETQDYANCWTDIGNCYYHLGQKRKAVSAWEISQPRYEKYSDPWCRVLEMMGLCYSELGDAQGVAYVMRLIQENNVHEMQKPCSEPRCLAERGHYYDLTGDHAQAQEHFQQALEKLASMPDSLSLRVMVYSAYAEFLCEQNDYQTGLDYYGVALQAQRQLDSLSEDYRKLQDAVSRYVALAQYNQQVSDLSSQLGSGVGGRVSARERRRLTTIIREESRDLPSTHSYLGELAYANSLATIAGCYAMLGRTDSAVAYYDLYIPSVRQAVSEEFSFEGEAERMQTWQEQKENLDELMGLLATLPKNRGKLLPRLASLAYDVELLGKGILLKSSMELEEVLRKAGNPTLLADYEAVKHNNAEISRLRAAHADLEQLLSLQQKNEQLLLQVMACPDLSSYTNYLRYRWQDVQQQLSDSDVAIEFAAVKSDVLEADCPLLALVLTRDMECPTVVRVSNLQEVRHMLTDSLLYDTPAAGQRLWGGELKPFLQGKRRLFFAADGALNSVAVEYLPLDGRPLSEQLEVYRLSSTKELCYAHHALRSQHVVLFGDIDYDSGSTLSAAADSALRSLQTRAAMVGAFAPLAATRMEILGIDSLLQARHADGVVRFSGTEAADSVFLGLTDSEVNILHIATHGTFAVDQTSTDAESMRRCALAFAGANLYEATDVPNGRVTAEQVARMNLRQCDLAVLSACESGLGKISADGVFGLQRGFKNAGVQTLLMSLKPVYDDSTSALMIAFYRRLLTGQSPRASLVSAQQEIRQCYPAARYWTPFILLDALDWSPFILIDGLN